MVNACSVFSSQPVGNAPLTKDAISYFLPTGRVHLVIDHKKSGQTDVSANEVIIPDTSQLYYAKYKNDPLSKDNFQVTVKNGLLQQVTSTTEDQTGTVAKNLAITAKQAFEIAAVGVGGAEDVTDFKIDATFDPFDRSEVDAINGKLRLIKGNLSRLTCNETTGVVSETSGFLYRPAYPYALTLSFEGGKAISDPDLGTYNPTLPGVAEFVVNLPSKCSPILSLDVDRTAFGKNVTTIDFSDGTLKDVNINKDSEIAGFSQIPVDVTSEILTLPQDLLTLRYKNMSAQDQLVTEQATLLGDQTKLIQAQQNFNAAQAAAVLTQPKQVNKSGAATTTNPTNPASNPTPAQIN